MGSQISAGIIGIGTGLTLGGVICYGTQKIASNINGGNEKIIKKPE